jgi:hypothetical protein
MVEIIKRDNKEYLVLERNEKEHIYEFAILKNLKKDYERTVIPKEEVLAIIAEFTNERNIIHRFSIRWGWGSIIGRIEKDRDGDEWTVMYYVPCEKQFAEYCEAKKEMVYLGEERYYEPRLRLEGHFPTYMIYCDLPGTLWIVYSPFSELFAKKLKERLSKDPQLLKEILGDRKVKDIFMLDVGDYGDYSILRSLERMIEKSEGCEKIDIPEDIAKKIV